MWAGRVWSSDLRPLPPWDKDQAFHMAEETHQNRHLTTILHSLLADNSKGVSPLEGISARLFLPVKWLQQFTEANLQISSTQC